MFPQLLTVTCIPQATSSRFGDVGVLSIFLVGKGISKLKAGVRRRFFTFAPLREVEAKTTYTANLPFGCFGPSTSQVYGV